MSNSPSSAEDTARDIFIHAESFAKAAETLAKQGEFDAKQKKEPLRKTLSLSEGAPIAVMDSFATELYLKSQHWIDWGHAPVKKLHTFVDLFNALKPATQQSIKTWYNEKRDGQYVGLLKQHSRDFPGFDHSLDNCLKMSNDTFTKMRYGFEGITTEIFYWPPLRVAIRNVIASTAPGWNWKP